MEDKAACHDATEKEALLSPVIQSLETSMTQGFKGHGGENKGVNVNVNQ